MGLLSVFKNTLALSMLQLVYIVTPLAVIPLIVGMFGLEDYGSLAYSITILFFLKVGIDYSFEMTATKSITIIKNSRLELQKKVSSIISVKIVLCLFLLPFYLLFSIVFIKMPFIYALFSYSTLFIDVFYINWFFQGMQKSLVLLFFRALSRVVFLILIFLMLSENGTVYQYFIYEIVGGGLGVILLFVFMKNKEGINIFQFSFDRAVIFLELKNGFDVFLSKASVSAYGTFNLLLLGSLASKEVFAIYSIVDKIFNSIKMVSSQFGNALIPYLVDTSNQKGYDSWVCLKKLILINQSFLIASGAFLFCFGNDIAGWLSGVIGSNLQEGLVNVFSLVLLFSIGPVFTAILIGQGRERVVRNITFKVMLLNSVLLYPFIYYFEALGLAYLVLITSTYQFILQIRSQCQYVVAKSEVK